MGRLRDIILFRGRIVRGSKREIRIYVFAEYRKYLEEHVDKEVEGILFIKE